MSCPTSLRFRPAGASDATAVAALHSDSWRRHYRGAYSDSFLDGDVDADRLEVWSARLAHPDPSRWTILAQEDGDLVGFAHVAFDEDPDWGALLDNLHVRHDHKRRGIGSRLLGLAAGAVLDRARPTRLYLWVLEQNLDAQTFYRACGASSAGRRPVSPPGGIASRLNGLRLPEARRYVWTDPSVLLYNG